MKPLQPAAPVGFRWPKSIAKSLRRGRPGAPFPNDSRGLRYECDRLGLFITAGPPGRIVEWLRSGAVQAVLDDRIAAEYLEVLLRPAFNLPPTEVTLVLTKISSQAFRIEAPPKPAAVDLPDPDDLPFLECARAAGVPLVTGNLRHFPKRVVGTTPLLTPAQFVTLARSESTHPTAPD